MYKADATEGLRTTELLARLCARPDEPRPAPTTVFVVAHPDDEVIGAGARLKRLGAAAVVA